MSDDTTKGTGSKRFVVSLTPEEVFNLLHENAEAQGTRWQESGYSKAYFPKLRFPKAKRTESKAIVAVYYESSREIGTNEEGYRIPEYFNPITLRLERTATGTIINADYLSEYSDELDRLMALLGEPQRYERASTTPVEERKRGTQRDIEDTRAGTLARVREFHRLRKEGMGVRKAAEKAKCDSRTYYDLCKEATEEDPIYANHAKTD